MNRRQKKHLGRILKDWVSEYKDKFAVGAEEHSGSELEDMSLLDLLEEAKKEFQDGYAYTHTALEQATNLVWENINLRAKVRYLEEEQEAQL
jgi:hypothetical protein